MIEKEAFNLAGADMVRYMCDISGVSVKALSEKIGCPYQSMRNKLYRDTFPFKEVEYIAGLLGFRIIAVQERTEDQQS